MKPAVMPFGPYAGATFDRLPDHYILSLIAPQRLRVALPRDLEEDLNREWSRRRKQEFQARRRAA